MKHFLLFQVSMGSATFLFEIKSDNRWSWSWIGISTENGHLIRIPWDDIPALYPSIELEIEELPFICFHVEFLYFLWSLKFSCVSSEDINILLPQHGIASASFDVHIRQNLPFILSKRVYLTRPEDSDLVLAKIPASKDKQLIVEEEGSMGVPGLVHIGYFSYWVGINIVNETLAGDVFEGEVDSSCYYVFFIANIQHWAEIVGAEVLGNRQAGKGSIGEGYLCEEVLGLSDMAE